MPYIVQEDRERLDAAIEQLRFLVHDDGQLNYAITRLVARYLGWDGWRYEMIARAVGALECVKLEFYRRLAGTYEDKAIAKNGDVPEYQ